MAGDEIEEETTPDEGDDEDVPEVDPDEKADVPTELAEQIADADDDPDEGDESEDDSEAETSDGDTSEEGDEPQDQAPAEAPSSVSWGETYVEGLAVVVIAVAEEVDESDDVDIDQDDILELATSGPIDLVEQASLMMEEWGAAEEMSPAGATLAGSAMVAFAVLVRETDAAGQAVSAVSESLGDIDMGGVA